MRDKLNNIFKSDINNRITCTVIAKRGVGSYTVQDDLGRSFIVTGPTDIHLFQKVVVFNGIILNQRLSTNRIRRISV